MVASLRELKPGTKGKIVRVDGCGRTRRRIVEMGVTPGSLIEVERVAPLGDPIAIRVRRYRLSLRKTEANLIMVALI